jgi:hypothetical protein
MTFVNIFFSSQLVSQVMSTFIIIIRCVIKLLLWFLKLKKKNSNSHHTIRKIYAGSKITRDNNETVYIHNFLVLKSILKKWGKK